MTKFVKSGWMQDAKKSQILRSARGVFLRYGFKRVSMNDVAVAAGVSRPALYLLFKNKEEIFVGVFRQWIDETIVEIGAEMAMITRPHDKVECAFEIWAVRPFELVVTLPDANELVECTFGFAKAAQRDGYAKFEAVLVPVIDSLGDDLPAQEHMEPERIAHLLSSAVRGFKQTATTPDELRQLIRELCLLCFSAG